MNFFGKRVLFLGAHPDDIELGCGALIHQIVKKTDVLCVTLSDNQQNPDLQDVKSEHIKSMKVLGVPEERVIFGPFITRIFQDSRQEILEYFLKLRKDFKPDLIFVHSKQDVHQDHNTMTDEALRAFRGITVLGFDVVRSSYGFFPHFLVEVTEEDVNKKIEALAQYKTYQDRYYFNSELTRSIMVRHGALAEVPFAEGFDILRIVGKFGE
ncbi:MAG: PIG-L deacetylase family protein [Anaerolineales bacterium]|nr:PIG-L family deacetylase [Anaerolineales bacterium]WKZ39478.1 MAG: PIG-L deacetylase family protein [Anaerolineales bacterium]